MLPRPTRSLARPAAEHLNPGGSVKDRPAAHMVAMAEREGRLVPRPRYAGSVDPPHPASLAASTASAAAPTAAGAAAASRGGSGTPNDDDDDVGSRYTVVEGTGGNTGIGLALVAAARGYRAIFTMPANIAKEKIELMRTLGAQVVVCDVVPFSDPRHYYHRARDIAAATPRAVWLNQFENTANSEAHRLTTGPEIWRQSGGRVGCGCR